MTHWTWSTFAEALTKTQAFLLGPDLAKRVTGLPRKFAELHRAGKNNGRGRMDAMVLLIWPIDADEKKLGAFAGAMA